MAELEVDQAICDHLSYLESMPPRTVEVFDFKCHFPDQFPPDSVHAIQVLQGYISQGWVEHGWRGSSGRYSLTAEGKAHLDALKAKLNR